MTTIYQKSNLVGGNFQDSQGNPISGGYLLWTLSHDSNVAVFGSPTGSQVVAGIKTKIFLDQNGSVSNNSFIWANSLLTPSGSYYRVSAHDNHGIEVWSSPQIFTLPYSVIIDLGTLQPLIP